MIYKRHSFGIETKVRGKTTWEGANRFERLGRIVNGSRLQEFLHLKIVQEKALGTRLEKQLKVTNLVTFSDESTNNFSLAMMLIKRSTQLWKHITDAMQTTNVLSRRVAWGIKRSNQRLFFIRAGLLQK